MAEPLQEQRRDNPFNGPAPVLGPRRERTRGALLSMRFLSYLSNGCLMLRSEQRERLEAWIIGFDRRVLV